MMKKMEIKKFNWDKDTGIVSWFYNEKMIERKFDSIYFASINLDEKQVYVEAGKNYSQDEICYLSFEGELIFIFNKIENKIKWKVLNNSIEVNCEGLKHAKYFKSQAVILVISIINQAKENLICYDVEGNLLFEKESPLGYKYVYLSSFEGTPSVVCEGGDLKVDSFGRNTWHYIINIKTGELLKGGLAY